MNNFTSNKQIKPKDWNLSSKFLTILKILAVSIYAYLSLCFYWTQTMNTHFLRSQGVQLNWIFIDEF